MSEPAEQEVETPVASAEVGQVEIVVTPAVEPPEELDE